MNAKIALLQQQNKSLTTALQQMVDAFGDVAVRGCRVPDYTGYQNGNGRDVGLILKRALKRARRTLKNTSA